MNKYDSLKLENQLCFPLYVASKELIRKYKPLLDKLDLTYTQYIAMMALWEHKRLKVTELGNLLYLDTGTISPLIRKLKTKGYITISRDDIDERVQIVEITKEGLELKDKALFVPNEISKEVCDDLSLDEMIKLKEILDKLISKSSQ